MEEKIKIYQKPMTKKEWSQNYGKPLQMPVRYHLIDCLKELKFGRPSESQIQIDKWIDDLKKDLDNGIPFS